LIILDLKDLEGLGVVGVVGILVEYGMMLDVQQG
jgi:hypothetical protein